MPWQPAPKMQVQRDVSQVRSQRKTCSSSAGSWNSTQARGKTRSTSGTSPAYALRRAQRRGPVASWHATRCARHRLQHGAPARGRRPPRRSADAGVLLQGAAAARRAPRRRTARSPSRASTRSPSSSATPSTLAEDKGCEEIYSFATSAVRDAGNGDDVLAHVEERTGVDHQVLPGRGRGPADLPRRTPLVRLVVGPARGLRHRRRLARDRRRCRRVARRRLVAAARRRPADPRALRRRAARREGAAQAAQADPDRRSPTTPAPCCVAVRPTTRWPPPRPSARWPGSAARRPRARARSCAASCPPPTLDEWIPKLLEMTDDDIADLPGVSGEPGPPDGRRRAGGRGGDGPLRPRASSRSARGRCAKASSSIGSTSSARAAERRGSRVRALDAPRSIPRPRPTPSSTPPGSATTPSR